MTAEETVLRTGHIDHRDILRVTPVLGKAERGRWQVFLRCGVFIIVPFAVLEEHTSQLLFDMDNVTMPRICNEESRANRHPCPMGPKFPRCLIR